MASESISKSVVWQLVGKFALQGIAFFITPIFTRILTPDDYGTITLYTSWSSILMVVLSLQTYGSIQTARIKFPKEEVHRYLSSTMTLSLITYAISFVIILIFRRFFSALFHLDENLTVLLIIHSFANYVIAFFVAYLDQHKKVIKSSIVSVSSAVISIALSLFFVIHFNNKVYGKVIGQAVPHIIFGIVLLFILYIKGRCFWSSEYNKYCILLTLPLILHGLGHMVFTQCDRILLERFKGEGVLGVYSVVYSLCSVLPIIFSAVNTAWTPFYYDFKKQKKNNDILKHGKRYIKFMTLIFSGFVLLSFDVFKLMAPIPYWEGVNIIPAFVLSFYFSYLYLFPVGFEYYCEKTKIIPIATITTALINIVLDIILIPKYSANGAAIATMIAQYLLFVFHFIAARFVIKREFEYRLSFFIAPIVFVIVSVIAGYLLIDYMIIRWVLFLFISACLAYDVMKYRSIF